MTTKLPAVLLLAVALTGCGGTNIRLNPDAGATGGYPEAADEVCVEVADRFAEAQADTPRSFEQAVELLTVLGDLARQGEEALSEVEAPAEDEDAYRRYLQARADVVAELERGLAAAQAEDGQAFADARDAVREGSGERERLARAAGLRGCAAAERG